MVNNIKLTPDLLKNWTSVWKNLSSNTEKHYLLKRLSDASTKSQLQSKLWLINELKNIKLNNKDIQTNTVAMIGGWFAHLILPLLIDEIDSYMIHNYEIDNGIKNVSYALNKRYENTLVNYSIIVKNPMIESFKQNYDVIINTACEHMFPMYKFKELNPALNSLYVLQSTNDTSFVDHINCVNSPEELIEQSKLNTIFYKGELKLDNGMTRYLVIGK